MAEIKWCPKCEGFQLLSKGEQIASEDDVHVEEFVCSNCGHIWHEVFYITINNDGEVIYSERY